MPKARNTASHTKPDHLFVGVAVALHTLALATATSAKAIAPAPSVTNDASGWQKLHQHLQHSAPHLPPAQIVVVLEATNTYWMELALRLHQWGYQLHLLNPQQAHCFAQSLRQHAKTDALDAQMLARLACERSADLPLWTPPPAIYAQLQQRLTQRDQLVEQQQQVRNRLAALHHRPDLVDSVAARDSRLIEWLATEIKILEAELKQLLAQDSDWQAAATHLLSITGIGPLTCAWLLVATLAFEGDYSLAQLTSFAGLAPHPYQSGTSVRGRGWTGSGCEGRLRRALYLAALTASRHNPQIAAFYQRLLACGKAKKVALLACAHKLLGLCRAVVLNKMDYDPHYVAATKKQTAPLAAVA